MVDTFLASKELLKETDYGLGFLVEKHLNVKDFMKWEREAVEGAYSDFRKLGAFVLNSQQESKIQMDLMFKL